MLLHTVALRLLLISRRVKNAVGFCLFTFSYSLFLIFVFCDFIIAILAACTKTHTLTSTFSVTLPFFFLVLHRGAQSLTVTCELRDFFLLPGLVVLRGQ